MSKIVLTHSYFYKFDAKQWKNQTPFPPLGTLYAASLLRENNFTVSLFDVGLKDSPKELKNELEENKTDYLVIYDDGFNYLTKMCLTNMREAAFEMIQFGKSNNCKVLICSSDATDHAEEYINKGADFIIYGEGEKTLLELIDKLENNEDYKSTEGIYYESESKEIIKNNPRKVYINLDDFPMPAWDLVDMDSYKEVWKNSNQPFTLNIATTRGCPYKCNWCAKPIYGQRYNSHSPERIVKMISFLKKTYGAERFWMCDDIFGLKPNWAQQFRNLLKKQNINIKYYIQSRADLLLKEDTIEAMAESGLEEVWIGAESGSQKILDAMDKGTSIKQIEDATKLLKDKGVSVAFFIQFGYLGETKEDIQKTIQMIKDFKPDNIGVSVSYPLPETPFYEKVKHQFKNKSNWSDSDDLAIMFQATFNQKYYRKLHRYCHKEFRKSQGLDNLIKGFRNPFKLNKFKIKSIISTIYYVPSSLVDKIQLSLMENK